MKRIFLFLITIAFPVITGAQTLPQGALRVTPSTGDLNTIFRLDASNSQSSQGGRNILEYQFKVSPNSPRSSFQRTPIYSFRAKETGTFNAQVFIRDTVSGATTTSFHRYTVRQELQRDIRINASNLNPVEGDEVTFSVTVFGSNLNRQQLKTRWDFQSDGVWDTSFRTGLTANFAAQVGTISPTVEVKFPDGQIVRGQGIYANGNSLSRNRLSSRGRTPVVTQSNSLKAPILQVRPSFTQAPVNTTFTFDGSDTKMTSGSYLEWVIEGQTIKNKPVLNYRFKSGGNQTVTLRHCLGLSDPDCLSTSTTITLQNQPNDQFLDITWYNLTDRGRTGQNLDYARATVSDTLRFTARALGQNTPGQKFRYRWDFNGDGNWDSSFSDQPSAEYTYLKTGEFAAVVEAQPALTAKNFTRLTKTIPVYVERNRAPHGSFDFRQDGNYVGEQVYYTAQASDQQSGQQVEVRFDSDADGVWDSDFRRQLSWYWVYDHPGNYLVRMQLRDPQGRITDVKKEVTILPLPEVDAKVKVSNREQAAGKSITLNATPSLGRGLTYEWKVLGQKNLTLPPGPNASIRLPEGDYTVCLTVRDRLGIADTLEFPISFVPAQNLVVKNVSVNNGVEKSPNVLQWLPGAPALHQENFVIPPGGVPRGPSPFVIEAGTAIPQDGFVSGMRAGR